MGIIDRILLKNEPKKEARKTTKVNIQQTSDTLTRKDIGMWRRAWQQAINVDNPNRKPLLDIYRDIEADLHVTGCITQRTLMVMSKTFKMVGFDGVEHPELLPIFDSVWFKDFIKGALSSIYWGTTLMELGDIVEVNGSKSFSYCNIVPRKHVVPEFTRIVRDKNDAWQSGEDYTQSPLADWVVEIGKRDDLGLLCKIAPSAIGKKNMISFWNTYGEVFGMPMRIAKTSNTTQDNLDKLEEMLREAGSSMYMVSSSDDTIEFVENAKSDAYNVYNQLIDRVNSEISKAIIGQTMTIEDGSSLSQSQTHLEVLGNIITSDCDMIRDVVNDKLLPLMRQKGFPLEGIRFEWDFSEDYTAEQQLAYEQMLLANFDCDPQYFQDKYGVKINGKKDNGFNLSHGSFFD